MIATRLLEHLGYYLSSVYPTHWNYSLHFVYAPSWVSFFKHLPALMHQKNAFLKCIQLHFICLTHRHTHSIKHTGSHWELWIVLFSHKACIPKAAILKGVLLFDNILTIVVYSKYQRTLLYRSMISEYMLNSNQLLVYQFNTLWDGHIFDVKNTQAILLMRICNAF